MPADTAAVTTGSAHCGGKCDGCAKISPTNVATALIVACLATLSVVRSICTSRPTVTAALYVARTGGRVNRFDPRADNAAHRGELRVLQREGGEDVAACHHQKAGEPGPRELLGGRAGKAARAQVIE